MGLLLLQELDEADWFCPTCCEGTTKNPKLQKLLNPGLGTKYEGSNVKGQRSTTGNVPVSTGCLQLGNELQKQSRDQTQAIKPADWSVWSRDRSASCKQPEKHGSRM